MPRELINPPEVFPPPGFSHVGIARGKQLVYFAGQVALDRNFNVVGPGDLAGQTRAALSNLKALMDAAGAGWDDIVRRTIYTLEPARYDVISAVITEVTRGAADPPQTLIGVTALALPELLIEIECTASID
jgi:enamine deaminase RidA (YjgF/YER057c/UK114 family)